MIQRNKLLPLELLVGAAAACMLPVVAASAVVAGTYIIANVASNRPYSGSARRGSRNTDRTLRLFTGR